MLFSTGLIIVPALTDEQELTASVTSAEGSGLILNFMGPPGAGESLAAVGTKGRGEGRGGEQRGCHTPDLPITVLVWHVTARSLPPPRWLRNYENEWG